MGSNLGDRSACLQAARERLAALPDALLAAASPIYETEPWGDPDQPAYHNQVVALTLGPTWTPHRLLAALWAIEADQGRIRHPKRPYGPRTLDLDILLFGALRLDTPELTIPHPRLRQRAFVLLPLADLAGDVPIPDGQGGSVAQALAKMPSKEVGKIVRATE
ncbi:2-amino-4-hydroxy-6-hydroxymethyldihydropteridine diphosphokinase [Desulfovibrio aerotolerans]|uniref:2-amino-4-hydroxy-6-hydroxymethyldihydropteridine pyrophosphokinase n=1 Tax=Solidesulfovibrio aerotolerans TaxID=295255 RepID=A0A7C9ITA1_9BACT|nr:2-amino-4-hydroxy-6-hydroxymethyldihydropteridine diphosphokinase [Solidesulfovibrio aerotolerans]MYL82160.1 2-amino-4-hydroxy-6-hydroxymethyldihydropteridine diphosphokinase [Solidesulfovibrio aerotolerans]